MINLIKFVFTRLVDTLLNGLFYFIGFFIKQDPNLWVLGTRNGAGFHDNPKYLFLYLNQKTKKQAIWITRKKNIRAMLRQNGYEAYLVWELKGVLLSLRAKVHVISVCCDDINPYTSVRAVKFIPMHGFPITERFGRNESSSIREKLLNNKWFKYLNKISTAGYWIYSETYQLCISNLFFETWKQALNLNDSRAVFANYPRNDIFINYNNLKDITLEDELKQAYKYIKKKKESDKAKVITYMPTWRPWEENQLFYGIKNENELNALAEFLSSENILLLIKVHPRYNTNKLCLDNQSNILILNPYIDAYPLLTLTDILITDYSSVYHDFLWRDKPIIFFPYDKEKYNDYYVFLYDYNQITPGPKVDSTYELIDKIKEIVSDKDEYSTARIKRRNEVFDFAEGSKLVIEQFDRILYNN